MRYCVLYPNTRNVNLVKEMGMMPYKLHKLYDYDSKIACYKLGEYPYLDYEVKGLKIDFVKNTFNNYSLDGFKYLIKQSKNIDVLQIFHVTIYSMIYAIAYKRLNKGGKLYIKLDCSHKLIGKILSLSKFRLKLLHLYLNKADIISVEQKKIYDELKSLLPKQRDKIIYIPDGVDFLYLEEEGLKYNYDCKENMILNVARIGSEEKNTKMLLEAFASIDSIEDMEWKLCLVGPIEETFKAYIEDFFQKYPKLKDIVVFKGELSDRKEIFQLYKKAKIFSLTSQFESFGFAFIEAAAFGDVIVSTDVGIAHEIVGEHNGALVKPGDVLGLKNKLYEFMTKDLKECSETTYKICRENYDWDKIIKNLHMNLKEM